MNSLTATVTQGRGRQNAAPYPGSEEELYAQWVKTAIFAVFTHWAQKKRDASDRISKEIRYNTLNQIFGHARRPAALRGKSGSVCVGARPPRPPKICLSKNLERRPDGHISTHVLCGNRHDFDKKPRRFSITNASFSEKSENDFLNAFAPIAGKIP